MNEQIKSIEIDSVSEQLWQLPEASFQRWLECRASHRFMAFKNKELIIFTLEDEKATVQKTLTCLEADIGLKTGMSSVWLDSLEGEITLSHTPVEVAPSVFLWHTFLTDLRYEPYKGQYNVRFSMLFRCLRNPAQKVSGPIYIMERATFDSEYK